MILPRCTPSTITRTLPLGNLRFWMTVAMTPVSQMSSRSGSSMRGSFWAARKIRLCDDCRACSRARTELSRPTMNGAIMWGKTTISRSGTRGRTSRFFCMYGAAMVLLSLGLAGFLVKHDRLDPARDYLFVDDDLLDVPLRRDRVHEVEHELLEDDPQTAGADVALERFLGDCGEGLVGELELHPFEFQHGLILADQAVLGLMQNPNQRFLVELLERGDDRQASDELRNQPVLDPV